jgi:acetyltransferase-like isoleucine patch superfamily enzyme
VLQYFFKVFRRFKISLRRLRLKLFLLEYKSLYRSRFSVPGDFRAGARFSLYFDASQSAISIGRNVVFRDDCQLRSGNNGKLTIGNDVFFNNFCSFHCLDQISIGDNCQFGEGVRIYDANHQYRDKDRLISEQGINSGKITIGKNCWIGANVVILKDVEIGDNVVIGAGAVVFRSVPGNTVVINKQEFLITGY